MTIQDIREAQSKLAGMQGRVVTEFRLPQAEIDALKSRLMPLVGYDDENPPPVDTIFGVRLTPSHFLRSVTFSDGSWALLNPGTLEWDKDKIFPAMLRLDAIPTVGRAE